MLKKIEKLLGLEPKTKKDPYKPGSKLSKADSNILGVQKAHDLADFIELRAILSFEIFGDRPIGAYLIQRRDQFKVRFGLDVEGYSSFSLEDELMPLWDGIIAATRTFPEKEPLGIRVASFTTARERVIQLAEEFQDCQSQPLRSLIFAELQNAQLMADKGYREPKTLQLFPAYTGYRHEDENQADRVVESSGDFIESIYTLYKGDKQQKKKKKTKINLKQFFLDSFSRGYQSWHDLFEQTIGVDLRALSPDEMWAILYSRVNLSAPPKIPYLIRVIQDASGLHVEQVGSPKFNISSYLQTDCTPFLDPGYVRLTRHDQHIGKESSNYIGALKFDDKVGGWGSGYEQVRFLNDILSRKNVTNTEIYVEIAAENKSKAAIQAGRLYQQAMLDAANAAKKTRFSAKSQDQIAEAKQAMLNLSRGDCPCSVGVFILIHRETKNSLDRAMQDLVTKLLPNPISIERDIAYRFWLQSFFCDFTNLCQVKGIGNLRFPYQSHEVPGFLPLITTKKGDRSGVEFLARDGGTPYHIQLFMQGREVNYAIIAGHRSGKTALSIDITTDSLCRGIPTTVLDYPAKDGRSGFYDFTRYVGGAYLDIGKESINILEPPDFRHLSLDLQKERFTDFKVFVVRQIMALVNPDPNDYQLKQACDDIVTSGLNQFFEDVLIQSRYESAMDAGFGSEEWKNMPTLWDYKEFVIPERLAISRTQADNPSVKEAFQFIQRRLTAKLTSPIGYAIGRPSTIRTDALLTVFALRSLEDEDSAVFSLAAFSLAARRSLEHEMSHVLFDESQQLAKFESISELAATFATTGAKQGIRCGFITNDFEALSLSPAGSSILASLNFRFIGRMETDEARKVGDAFNLSPTLLEYTYGPKFKRNPQKLSSSWIINEGSHSIFVERCTPPRKVSLAASNSWEADPRQAYFDLYGFEEGLKRFSEVHISALKNGTPLTMPDVPEALQLPPSQISSQSEEFAHAS